MKAVASDRTVRLVAALIKAVEDQSWNVAFGIARKLNRQSDLSLREIAALRLLARRAARVVTLNLRSQKNTQATSVLAKLRILSWELTRTAHLAKPRWPQNIQRRHRDLEQVVSHFVMLHEPKEKKNGPSRTFRETRGVELHKGERSWRRSPPIKKAPPSDLKTEQVERIPHMEIGRSLVDKFFEVTVFANTMPPDSGAIVEKLKIRVPKRVLQFKVTVLFGCSAHFRIEGSNEASLVFSRTRLDSTVAKFTVFLAEPKHPAPMFFTALFHYNHRPCGKIMRFATYDRTAKLLTWTDPPDGKTSKDTTDYQLPNDVRTSNLSIDFNASPSDIRIEVLKTPTDDGRTFQLHCYTPAGDWKGLWILPHESDKFVRMQMADFVAAPGDESLATLQGAGIHFWNSVTPEAKDLLKNAFKRHRVATISVLSEEPFVPWELMIPVDIGQPPVACLGVAYSMGRWITGDFRSPAQFIPMRSAFIVAPEKSDLALAPKEASFLRQTLPGSRQIKPVSFSKLNSGLKSSKHDIVHFICHGEAAGTPILKLDPKDVVSSTQVIALVGFLAAFGRHPFTFLNSCEVGQAVRTLAGLGGFPNAFLRLGAAALVAPLWSVEDPVAEKVCKLFYKQVLAGKTFGEVMKSIRARAFHNGTDTFASYCYYGDPRATAVRKTRAR